MIHQFRTIVDRFDFDSGWQRTFDFFEFLLERPRYLVAVFTHQHETEPQNRLAISVRSYRTLPNFVANLNFGDVTNAKRYAVASCHDNVFDLLNVEYSALSMNQQHSPCVVDVASADVAIVGFQCLHDLVKCQFMSNQSQRIKPYLKLFFVATPAVYLSHAGHTP